MYGRRRILLVPYLLYVRPVGNKRYEKEGSSFSSLQSQEKRKNQYDRKKRTQKNQERNGPSGGGVNPPLREVLRRKKRSGKISSMPLKKLRRKGNILKEYSPEGYQGEKETFRLCSIEGRKIH